MKHLSPEELVDVAEGLRAEPGHLGECVACRRELESMRALMGAVADVEVPEPSPLFWQHFSARVHDAVAAEPQPRSRWFAPAPGWRFALPVAALAAAAVALLVVAPVRRPAASRTPVAVAAQPAPAAPASAPGEGAMPVAETSDPSFLFVSDLTAGMDMDTALEAGLVSDGTGDHAIAHLSDDELRALAALLRAELAHERVS